jgi:sulfur carrier protein
MVAASFHEALYDSSVTSRPGGSTGLSPVLGRLPVTGDNPRMNLRLNGERLVLSTPCTLAELLLAQGLGERRVAVEVNGEIIPRSRHPDHPLADGDVIEIVHALGGG